MEDESDHRVDECRRYNTARVKSTRLRWFFLKGLLEFCIGMTKRHGFRTTKCTQYRISGSTKFYGLISVLWYLFSYVWFTAYKVCTSSAGAILFESPRFRIAQTTRHPQLWFSIYCIVLSVLRRCYVGATILYNTFPASTCWHGSSLF